MALIKTYPGIDPALLLAAADAGARGVVLEGTGAGNVPVELFAAISDLTEWDIPVVVASRCHTGPATLESLPPGSGLTAGKARCALMVALGDGGGVAAARDWFAHL